MGSAGTDHEAVIRLLTTGHASCELTPGVDKGASDTGDDNNVLFWVIEVDEGGEVLEEFLIIAESVDKVGGLSQLNGGNVELGGFSGKPDFRVVHN